MGALVTNLTQVLPLDALDMTLAAVGGADFAIPSAGGGSVGIDGVTNCQNLENTGTELVAGAWYSAYQAFAQSYDLSQVDQAFIVYFRDQAPSNYNALGGLRVGYFSGGDTDNWAYWQVSATAELLNNNWWPIFCAGAPTADSGTFDNTDLTGIIIYLQASGNGFVFGLQVYVDQLLYVNGPAILSRDATPGTLAMGDFYERFKATSGEDYHSLLVNRAGPTYEFGIPVSLQCDDFADSNLSLAFKPADGVGFPTAAPGYFQLEIIGQASGSVVIDNLILVNTATDYILTVDASAASTTVQLSSLFCAGLSDARLFGAGLIVTQGVISSPDTISISDGDFDLTVKSAAAPLVIDGDLIAGSTITIVSPAADAIQFEFAAADYSDLNFTVPADATVNIDHAAPGTWIFTGLTSAGTVNVDTLTANDVTVTVAAALDAQAVSPSSGGGTVTIDKPATTVTVSVSGLVVGEDRIILARNDGSGGINTAEYSLASGNDSGNSTVMVSAAINADTPASGVVCVYNAALSRFDRYQYSSYAGSTFALTGALSQNYDAGDDAFAPFLHKLASAATESTTLEFSSNIDVAGFARDGGVTPIEPFPISGTITSAGFSVNIVRAETV